MKEAKAIIVCGLGFGDEGKGTITDALARKYGASTVVRYNGGPQAGHNVVTPEGNWHCFAQFGAASFVPGVRTILSRHMLVNPDNMDVEAGILETKGVGDIWQRLTVDPRCSVITPMQKTVGRMREIARGDRHHGSCGQGVGETVLDSENGRVLTVGDIIDGDAAAMLRRLAEVKVDQASDLFRSHRGNAALQAMYGDMLNFLDAGVLAHRCRFILQPPPFNVEIDESALGGALGLDSPVIFEGAQGALLDRKRGVAPHVTKSDTTCRNALDLLRASASPPLRLFKLGVFRAYGHRHGAGPLPTEDESLRDRFDDPRNKENPWQGRFRVGWLDLPAIERGIRFNGGVDGLALTCLDQLTGLQRIPLCFDPAAARPYTAHLPGWQEDIGAINRHEDLPAEAKAFIAFIEKRLGVPVAVVSVGPRADQKLFLRG